MRISRIVPMVLAALFLCLPVAAVSLALAGTGRGVDLCVDFGKFVIERR